MVEAQFAHLGALGGLEEGDVVVLGTEGQEGGVALSEAHDFHPKGLGIELDRRLDVLHAENHVSYLVNLSHVALLIACRYACPYLLG